MLNLKGAVPKLRAGDKVLFYIPPTAEEAELAQRKVKHLPQYRGPAVITRVLTPTTYELKYGNRTYKRCLSELRQYRVKGRPALNTGVAPDTATSFEKDAFVAYRDTDDPDDDDSKRYHLGKVINVADGNAHLHCYATAGKALSRAKWLPLYQSNTGDYSIGNTRHGDAVIDQIPVEEEEWVLHYNVQLDANKRINKRVRQQLADMSVTHHRIDHTFP